MNRNRYFWSGALILIIVLSILAPVAAQGGGPLDGSFSGMLALRRVPVSDVSGQSGQIAVLAPQGETVVETPIAVSNSAIHVLGWRGTGDLLYVQQGEAGELDAMLYNPADATQLVLASGLPGDQRYAMLDDGRVIGWTASGLLTDVSLYDPATMSAVSSHNVAAAGLSDAELAGSSGSLVYFYTTRGGDTLLAVDPQTGMLYGPVDALAAGDGAETVAYAAIVSGGPLWLAGTTSPKAMSAVAEIPLAGDGSFLTTDAQPRPLAGAVAHPLGVSAVQRVMPWAGGGVVISALPGDFSGSDVTLVDASFQNIVGGPVRTAFNSCVLFTPDARWMLFLSRDGGALQAVPVADPVAGPVTLLTGEPRLDLCGASWLPAELMPTAVATEQSIEIGVPGQIAAGQAVTGEVTGEQPAAEFALPLAAGEPVTITMERLGGNLDSFLILIGPDGRELMRNDDAAIQVGDTFMNAQIAGFVPPVAGTYTVRATRFGEQNGISTGPFRLTVTSGGEPLAIASPTPAAITVTATPVPPTTAGSVLRVGDVVAGEINDNQPRIPYTITLEAGQVVTFTMERMPDSQLDSYLILRNPNGDEVARNDDAAATVGSSSLNAQIADYRVSTSGTFTLEATRWQQETGSSSGEYQLSVTPGRTLTVTTTGTALRVGDVVSGEISDAQPRILYTIALEAGQSVTFTMERTSGQLDSYLILRDPNGDEVARNDDAAATVGSSGLNAQIANYRVFIGGTYTLEATRWQQESGSSSGRFWLTVEQGVAPAAGQTLEVGSVVTGSIDAEQYAVEYPVVLTAGQAVTFTMVRTDGDLDALLILLDSRGVEVARNDDADVIVGDTFVNAQIAGFVSSAGGAYTLRATRYREAYGSSSGAYELRMTAGGAPPAISPTPAAPAVGQTLEVGSVVTGSINAGQYAVEYPVVLTAGQAVTFTMVRTDGDLDALLILLDSRGVEAARNDDASTPVGDTWLNAQIVGFVSPADGAYTLRATRYREASGSSSGAYELRMTAGGAAVIPGAAVVSGGPIGLNQPTTGTIDNSRPIIEYAVLLEAGQQITITMEWTSGNLDPYLNLLDPGRNLIAYNDDAAQRVGTSGLNAQITGFTVPANGIYMVQATRFGQENGSSSGGFQLTVSSFAGAPATPVPGVVGSVNNGVQTGQEVRVGSVVDGMISVEVYTIEYPITLNAGDTIKVSMERTSGNLDPLLVIFGLDDQAAAFNDDASAVGGYNAQIASFTAPGTGVYYIWATRYRLEQGTSTGTFTMRVEQGVPVEAISGGPVQIGDVKVNALTNTVFAVDYTITLQAGQIITVTMEALNPGLDSSLVILSQAGEELAYNDDAAAQVGESVLNAQIVGFSAPATGTYTIRATRYFAEGGSSIGRFRLTIAAGSAAPSTTTK